MSNETLEVVEVGYQGLPLSPQAIPVGVANKSAVAGVKAGYFLAQTPTISALTRTTGYLSATRPLIIRGSNLATTTSVTFGQYPAIWFYATDSEIRCLPPPVLSAGTVTVTVTTAAAPGATPATATSTYTYLTSTIAGTQTVLFNSASPGFWYGSPMTLGEDGKVYFVANILNSSLPNLSGPASVAMAFTPATSPTLQLIATAGSGGSGAPLGLAYATFQFHVLHGTVADSTGTTFTFDHHGNLNRQVFADLNSSCITSSWIIPNSGDVDPGGITGAILNHPDGDLLLTGSNSDGSQGIIWKIDPRNPVHQIKKYFTPGDFFNGCVGPDGNLFLTDALNDKIWHIDSTTLNVIGSYSTTTFPFGVVMGGDRCLYVTCGGFGSQGFIYKIHADLVTTSTLNVPGFALQQLAIGPDGNLYVTASNQSATPAADSVCTVIRLSDFSILSTFTLTGSGGATSTSGKGGVSGCVADDAGGMWFSVDLDNSGGTVGTHQGNVIHLV